MSVYLPSFYVFIFPHVFWNHGFSEVCFTCILETLLHRTEKVCADFVQVFKRSHNVGGTRNSLYLFLLHDIKHAYCVTEKF